MEDDLSDGIPGHSRSSSEMPFLLSPKGTIAAAHKPKSHKRLCQIGRPEVIMMLLVFVIILQSVFMWRGSYCFGELTGASDRPCSNRANFPVPEFRTQTQEFYNTTSEYGIWKIPWTEAEWMRWYKNWEALYPPGRGMVKVVDPGQYAGIPPPMDDFEGKEPPADGGYRYELAITHQLHCLWVMQRYFYEIQAGLRRGDHWSTFFHINHCTDYLRWSLLCKADTTLEGWDEEKLNNPNPHPRHRGPSGLHAPHQCTDYKQVYSWMEENRWYDLKSMDNDIPENSTYQDWTTIWGRTREWMET